MPVPTSYTEAELAAFMVSELGDMATALDIDAGSLDEAVVNSLLAAGVSDIADVESTEDIVKLRALARVEAWKKAAANASSRYDASADNSSLSRNQLFDHCARMLSDARSDAMAYDANNVALVDSIAFGDNPYRNE